MRERDSLLVSSQELLARMQDEKMMRERKMGRERERERESGRDD